jgi:hypothetical protein
MVRRGCRDLVCSLLVAFCPVDCAVGLCRYGGLISLSEAMGWMERNSVEGEGVRE